MNKERIEEIAIAVAMVEYYQKIIDDAKEEIRNLSEKEVEKINEGNDMKIKRGAHTTTTYSNEYKEAVKEIAKKYPPIKMTKENYRIELTATSYTISKRKIITDKFTKLNKTQLKLASKNSKIK